MRLIRLFTRDENAVFENNFNTDIVIKPYSKIALQSASFEVQPDSIVIDSNNDELEYQISGSDGVKKATLTHDIYTESTISDLLQDIANKLNVPLLTTLSSDIGVEWRAIINKLNKVLIEYRRGPNVNLDSYILNNVSKTTPPGSGSINAVYFSSDGVATNQYTNFLYNTNFIARGGGLFSCRIQELSDNGGASDTNGCIFGLTTVNVDSVAGKVITNDIIKMAIVVGKPSDNYGVINNGVVAVPSVFAPKKETLDANAQNNDNIQIAIEDGKIKARILYYDNTQPSNRGYMTLFEEDYNGEDKLYPFIIYRGAEANMKTAKHLFYQSPFNTSLHAGGIITDDDPLGVAPPRVPSTPSLQFFSFENTTLNVFLGFSQNRYPLTGTEKIDTISIDAEKSIRSIEINELYIVEMLNLKLNSYDGLSQERRSILSTIPKKVDFTVVNYEPNEKIFVDIDNAEPLSLRNINAIIRNNDLSLIETKGLASLTLVIKDSNEN